MKGSHYTMEVSGKIVLLGAGASAPDSEGAVGVPTARAMTQEMLRLVENEPQDIRHAIRLAVSALVFGSGIRGEDPGLGVNIEDVFNLLETLERRNSLEAAPLIGSWNPVVESLDRVMTKPRVRNPNSLRVSGFSSIGNDRSIDEVVRELEQIARGGAGGFSHNLKRALSAFAENIQNGDRRGTNSRPPEVAVTRDIPGQGMIYRKARECLIRKLNDLVWLTDKGFAARFAPLVRAAKTEGFTIATLNYDNSIELSANSEGLSVDLGITRWFQDDTDQSDVAGNHINLLKLHGSIDWQLVTSQDEVAGKLRTKRIHRMSREEMEEGIRDPSLIFGGQNKLTASGPFLDLLMMFRNQLFDSKELIVIGYSFADQHINDLIEEWLAGSSDSKITIVSGKGISAAPKGSFADRVLSLGGERVKNTGLYAKEAIESLFPALE